MKKVRITPIGKRIGRMKPGETILVTEYQARALVAARMARRVDEDEAEVEISPRTGKPKRRYRRRDMAAEQ